MTTISIILSSLAATLIALLVLMRFAPLAQLMDLPGGRKDHDRATPLVGGLAVGINLTIFLYVLAPSNGSAMALCVLLLLAIGTADDRSEISPLPKFIAQAVAAMIMALIGQVQLRTVGNLAGFGPIGLWIFVLPMTAFATIGVINAFNMADGLDGHSAIAIMVALAAYALVANDPALLEQYRILLVLLGGMFAFSLLNLRLPWQSRARVFLGDAGSMLMGFLLAWFAIDLTQGPGRDFPPICALWVVVIPLCDCVSLMLRRLKNGRNPLAADRQHLHHWLLDRGLSVPRANLLMLIASLICASIGVAGWQLHVPEPILFAAFVSLFLAHHIGMSRYFRERNVMSTAMQDSGGGVPDDRVRPIARSD